MYLATHLQKYFSSDSPLFKQVMQLRGECYRHQKGRLTQRIRLGDKYYFIKQHFGVGIKEIIKNLLQGRWPVTSAKNEWLAIQKSQSLHIQTAALVGYGISGYNPAKKQSFVLLEELQETISLEDLGKKWQTTPPSIKFKHKLIDAVAQIARVLHENGINHRDFYLCHFLLSKAALEAEQPELALIDLHRAQIRHLTPRRWIIKDLAGLYFSSMDFRLTRRDYLRFIKAYRGRSLREILTTEQSFWKKVQLRAEQLYRHH